MSRRQRGRRRDGRSQRGFTILEILLVLGLSFVGLYGIATVMQVAQRSAMTARAITEATALAQDKLEQLGHQSLTSLASTTENTLGPQGTVVANGAYTRTTTITVNGTTYTLRVQVSWRDAQQRLHAVTLATQRAP